MIYHCADFIVSHKLTYMHTHYAYALLSAVAFDIISLCVRLFLWAAFWYFHKYFKHVLCQKRWYSPAVSGCNRFCSSSLSKDLPLRTPPLASCIVYQLSANWQAFVLRGTVYLPCFCCDCFVVQLSRGALEAHATVSFIYSINVIDLIYSSSPLLLPHDGTFPVFESFVLLFGFYVHKWRTQLARTWFVLQPKTKHTSCLTLSSPSPV